jgi:predicted MFS family arabinose efflux permease
MYTKQIGHADQMFLWLTFGLAIAKTARSLLPPLLPAIIADLNISSVEAGLGLSLLAACYALFQFPGGRASDRLSRKTILLTSLMILCLGAAVMIYSGTFFLFLPGAIFIGAGVGLYGPADRALLSDLFTE